MEIKLFSVRSFTGSTLKSKLETMLTDHNLPFEVSEYTHADDFLKEGITSIPAIKVMDKVIYHQEGSNIDETIKHVLDILQQEYPQYIIYIRLAC